jgi:Tfp pilus assembly protein PilW
MPFAPPYRDPATMKTKTPSIFRQARAMTLVELLIAMVITAFVVTCAATMLMQCLKMYDRDVNRLSTNFDMRKFTLGMETDAAFANHFYIYDIDTNGIPSSSPAAGIPVTQGQSGDLLLLVTTATALNGSTTVSRVVAYCRGNPGVKSTTTTNTTALPVYRYDTQTTTGPLVSLNVLGTTLTEALYSNAIPALGNTSIEAKLKAVVNAPQPFLPTATLIGTATDNPAAGQKHTNLFYYLPTGAAFMVQSQIMEQQNNQTVLSIDTYNMTMWPRS